MTILNMGSYVQAPSVYAITIDESVSDPSQAVTYPSTAFGMRVTNAAFTPASSTSDFGDWDDCDLLSGIKRVTGTTGYSKDFTEHTFTETITVDNTRFIGTRFPTYWLKSEKVGTKITIALSPTQVDSTWTDYAGTYQGNRRGYFDLAEYVSAVKGSSGSIALVADGRYTASQTPAVVYDETKEFTQPYEHLYLFTQRQYVNILCMMMYKTLSMETICGHSVAATSYKGAVTTQVPASWNNKYGFRKGSGDKASAVFGLSRWNDIWSVLHNEMQRGGVAMGGVTIDTYNSSVTPYEGGTSEKISVEILIGINNTNSKVVGMYGTGGYPLLPVKGEAYKGTSIPNGWTSIVFLTGQGNYIGTSSNTGSLPPGLAFGKASSRGFVRLAFY